MNIKEVAARAKVSTATISRTINQSGLVSPETAERVWKAIRELGYYPNTHARALVSGRSRLFGLIISDIANPFFPELVKSFEDAAILHSYDVIVANTDYKSDRMTVCVRRMIERKVEGVAVLTSEIDPHLVEELARQKLPIVFLDMGKVKPLIHDITVDYETGIREAFQHLVSLGHRRIGFISGPLSLKSARARRTTFVDCLAENNLRDDTPMIAQGNHRVDGGQTAMRELLGLPNPPTGVLCSNDLTAIGALHAIFNAGLSVPNDISVVGFDDIELSQFTQPPLTTVRLSRKDLGRRAFEALYRSAEGLVKTGQKIKLGTTLVVRESTAFAKNSSQAKAIAAPRIAKNNTH